MRRLPLSMAHILLIKYLTIPFQLLNWTWRKSGVLEHGGGTSTRCTLVLRHWQCGAVCGGEPHTDITTISANETISRCPRMNSQVSTFHLWQSLGILSNINGNRKLCKRKQLSTSAARTQTNPKPLPQPLRQNSLQMPAAHISLYSFYIYITHAQ